MEKLDILVANAGVNRDNLFVQFRDEDWDRVIAVNLTADVPSHARRRVTHDAPPLGSRHRYYVGGRIYRKSGTGKLHGFKGGNWSG